MSELESIGRLRTEVIKWVGTEDWRTIDDDFYRLVDAIEAEIAERFVELPYGRDYEPIHVGDRVKLLHNGAVREVTGLTRNPNGGWCVSCDSGGAFMWPESQGNVIHAPRTLEDVLNDFAVEAADVDERDKEEWEPLLAKYEREIRELIGGAE